ncbi:hypothetical protein ACFTWD_35870 [Streptomyces sp. NPDC056943]|uniref:hypothetical protein n=1 Tax=Streptomyces sp. NPDC056943 TaxID=3345971 RepID=UPI00363A9360
MDQTAVVGVGEARCELACDLQQARRAQGAPLPYEVMQVRCRYEDRKADSARRRQRVIKAINAARRDGTAISVSGIARQAGVDPAFHYRHKDLLAQVHGAGIEPPGDNLGPLVSRALLQADLANALERSNRLAARTRQLEAKLSELLGEQAWRESGLGAPDDIDQLKRRITNLEQEVVTLAGQLEERDEELVAARAANRQLISRLDTSH